MGAVVLMMSFSWGWRGGISTPWACAGAYHPLMPDPTAMPQPATDAIPWARIVADVADALIFIDTQGVIRVWNAPCAALFGFGADEALGHSVDLIIPEHLRSAHWHGFEQALARGATRHGAEVRTTRATHKDGRKLYVDMTFSVVKDEDGRVLGSAAMARDVTERYLAERARKAAG